MLKRGIEMIMSRSWSALAQCWCAIHIGSTSFRYETCDLTLWKAFNNGIDQANWEIPSESGIILFLLNINPIVDIDGDWRELTRCSRRLLRSQSCILRQNTHSIQLILGHSIQFSSTRIWWSFSFYRLSRAVVEGTNFGSIVQANCFFFSVSYGIERSAAERVKGETVIKKAS